MSAGVDAASALGTGTAAALVTAAVVLLGSPRAARARLRAAPVHGRGAGPRRRPAPPRDPTSALAATVAAVAAELRAGRSPADAWQTALGVPVPPDGVPTVPDVVGALVRQARGPRRSSARLLRPHGQGGPLAPGGPVHERVAGVLAATSLATVLGAPLAGVLELSARTLAQDAEAETAVRAALAGPQQTTRLLTGLPLVGVGLGSVLGADVLGVLLDGGTGTASGLLGLVLVAVGRWWVARMVAGARRAGRGSGPGGSPGGGRLGDGCRPRPASAVAPGEWPG